MLASFIATALALQAGGAPPAPPQAAPGSGQEQPPPRSTALEDLLRRLAEERAAAGAPAAAPSEEPARAPVVPNSERPVLRRGSDSVQIAFANGKRRQLTWWDARVELSSGDEVRQDGKATVLVDFADGAHFRVEGTAVWRLAGDPATSPRRVEFEELRRSGEFQFGDADLDTVLSLPGGNEIAGRRTHLVVHDFDLRAHEIRNGGPESVVIRSPYLGARLLTLAPGQHVWLPALPEPSAFVSHLTHEAAIFDAMRGRLVVQAPDEIDLTARESSVLLAAKGPIAGVARACGSRFVVQPGTSLTLTRVPLGFERVPETRR
jgi:hypothetical protein